MLVAVDPESRSCLSSKFISPYLSSLIIITYFSTTLKDLALETLRDSGYKIIQWRYTGAALNILNRSLRTNLAKFPRHLVYTLNKDWGVRLLGGETLIVIAE